MAVGDAYVFRGFLTTVLTQLFLPKPLTTFLTCFCRGERQKCASKKFRLNRGWNSQPPGHESDTLTTEPPRRGLVKKKMLVRSSFSFCKDKPVNFVAFFFFCAESSHFGQVLRLFNQYPIE